MGRDDTLTVEGSAQTIRSLGDKCRSCGLGRYVMPGAPGLDFETGDSKSIEHR